MGDVSHARLRSSLWWHSARRTKSFLRRRADRYFPVRQIRRLLRIRETAMDHKEPFNVLFLCTGNSARSIMAEAILNSLGKDKFKAFSAGCHSTGVVNPFALELLEKNQLPTQGLRSKDWNEFAPPGAPFMHFVFTVCDHAAAERCPVWPGQPMTAHWGVHDPAAVEGTIEEKRRAFLKAYTELHRRILLFINLPIEKTHRSRSQGET